MANWKEFARRLLTHRNPYTGLTYAEDPALYSLNLVNENPLVSIWNRIPQLVPLFEERYVEFTPCASFIGKKRKRACLGY